MNLKKKVLMFKHYLALILKDVFEDRPKYKN